MPPARRAGSIAAIGLTGAPSTAAEVDRGPTVPVPQGAKASSARPSATAATTVSTKVRYHVDELHAQQELLFAMRRTARLKRLDRAEVDRALWRLLAADPVLQQRVLDDLG